MRNFLCIVGSGDIPLYEAQLTPSLSKTNKEDLIEFLLHASIDAVEMKLFSSSSLIFRAVDKFNDLAISALISVGQVKVLLLHDFRLDDTLLKAFFYEIYDLYVKLTLNPFYERHAVITSQAFDDRARAIGEKYLRA